MDSYRQAWLIGRHHLALLLDLGEGILPLTDNYNLIAQVFDEFIKHHSATRFVAGGDRI